MITRAFVLLPFMALLATASGCSDSDTTASSSGSGLSCGAGTVQQNGVCVPADTSSSATGGLECGPGTTEVSGECVADTGLTCGEGTWPYNGECVGYDPNDTTPPTTTYDPPAGELPNLYPVTLTTDEPATIYYSLDGSAPGPGGLSGFSPLTVPILGLDQADVTLRFYASDPAGNDEPEKTVVYSLNVAPPGVDMLAVGVIGVDATVSWVAPPEAAGVIVATGTPYGAPPVDGTTYAVGDTLPGGQQVVYVGAASMTTDVGVTPGLAQYTAWAYDEFSAYSSARTAARVVTVPKQTGTMTIDVAAGTVTVNTAPSHVGVTGSATFSAGTLDVSLNLENQLTRVLYNVKLVVNSASGTQGALAPDGTLTGKPYFYFDPFGVAPGQTASDSAQVTGVGATDIITVAFDVVNHPLLIGPSDWTTSSNGADLVGDTGTNLRAGSAQDAELPWVSAIAGPKNERQYYWGSLSLDGQKIYAGARQAAYLGILDMTTLQEVASVKLFPEGTKGFVGWPVLDVARNIVYAVATKGAHSYETSTGTYPREVHLVAVDASTLKELGRVNLAIADGMSVNVRGRDVAVSPDGKLAIVTVKDDTAPSTVHFVDLTTMTEIDLDPVAAGVQPLDTNVASSGFVANRVVFSVDGSKAYVSPTGDAVNDDILEIDVATRVATAIAVPHGRYVSAMEIGPNGVLFMGAGNGNAGVFTYNPMTQVVATLPYPSTVGALAFGANGELWVQRDYNDAYFEHVDTTTGAVLSSMDINGTSSHYGHGMAVTPF